MKGTNKVTQQKNGRKFKRQQRVETDNRKDKKIKGEKTGSEEESGVNIESKREREREETKIAWPILQKEIKEYKNAQESKALKEKKTFEN